MANNQQEQFSEFQSKNMDAAMKLAQLSIENSQRIMELQINTARSLFEEGVANSKALAAASDPREAMALRTQFAQISTEKMLTCARQIAEITSNTQSEVGRMVTQQLSTGSKDMVEAFQKVFKGMPIADSGALGAMQTAMDTARAAFDQVTRASQEAFSTFSTMAQKAGNAAGAPKSKK